MFKNYLKIAYRNLIRNKLYTTISVSGLAIGIACCLLIFLYIQKEWSFDRFHQHGDNIYRMIRFESEVGEFAEGSASTSGLLGPVLKAAFPEVENVTRVSESQCVVRYGDKSFSENVVHVDPDFFRMFSFPLIQGDAAAILGKPFDVVITPEIAQKYFGDENPLGKTISILLGDGPYDFMVTGVIQKAPSNSSIQYGLLISIDLLKHSMPERILQTWNNIIFPTMVQLKPGTDIAAFEENVTRHVNNIAGERGVDYVLKYKTQRLRDIHLNPRLGGMSVSSSDPVYSYILSAIALLVLLIACINFTTLAVGRSASRAREVGLRKVMGAQRWQIMKQFWGEPLLLSVIALILGIVLTELFLPTFNDLAQKRLSLDLFSDPLILPALIALTLLTALAAGIYPSMLLSKLYPVETLRGVQQIGGKNRLIQGLVILQFVISVFLLISTFIISAQMNYVGSRSLGYDKSFVVTFPTGSDGEDAANLLKRFRNELSGQPAVVDVSGYSYAIGQSWLYINYGHEEGMRVLIGEDVTGPGYASGTAASQDFYYVNWVDANYIPTMGIKIVEGRNFSEEFPTDRDGAIIINQTLAKQLEWENPLGQRLPRGFKDAVVVGVVEDFHYYPLQRKIDPLVLHLPRNDHLGSISEIAVRIRGGNVSETLSTLENTWTDVSSGLPFTYQFLDDKVAEQYAAEQRWRKIVQYSFVLSILVTCLGLFGLTSLAVAKRTREVGIRKVLGASVSDIVGLISREFIVLVIVAIVLAAPVAWYVMSRWLENFAYRAEISPLLFLFSGVIALMIALLTVSYQAIKAAVSNPVEALRYE